jgi:predicted permease
MILGEWARRLTYLLRRRAMEEELRREMESHRAQMDDPRAFGNTLRLRDEARDAWGWRWLDDLTHDVRFSLRTLRRSPGFTIPAVITLAFGIGVNSAMFTLVNSLLLRPLYEDAGEVVSVHGRSTQPSGGIRGVSYPNYLDLQAGTTGSFANLAAFSTILVGLDLGDGIRRTLASGTTASYFEIFDTPLALGRPFTAGEERRGADARVAVISFQQWEQRGADPAMIGRTVRVNGEPFTVIGIAAKGFTGPGIPGPDLWLPLNAQTALSQSAVNPLDARDAHDLSVVGRLAPGTPVESVTPALATVASRLEQAFPAVNRGYTLELSKPSRLLFMPGPGSTVMTATLSVLLMAMPAIVLLVACLNLTDLLLARGHVRRQELALRSSLGGGRGRLVRQLLTEGVLLALAGGALGLLLSTWATETLLASLRPVLPVAVGLPEFDLDWRVLVGTVAFSLAASVLFSAWPAWLLTGRASASALKRQAGEDATQPGGVRFGTALVIGQVALSLLLVVSGGLFLMSAVASTKADPGFRLDGGLVVEVDPSLAGYDEARGRESYREVVSRLRTVPGVDAVTVGSSLPFNGFGDSRNVIRAGADAQSNAVDSVFIATGGDYFRTLGLTMLAGRDFVDAELSPGASEPVAIVDDALAQGLWPGEDALGRLIQFRDAEGAETGRTMRVIGVAPALKHSLGNPRLYPHVYVPLGQHYESVMPLHLRIAGAGDQRAMMGTVARVVHEVDERLPILRLETWRDRLDGGVEVLVYRVGGRVFSTFAAVALLLAVIGVYGVKSYVVSRRTREFGIRIATGAHPRALLWQVLREGGRTTLIGIALGLVLSLGAGQLLRGFLYGVNGIEPLVMLAAPVILIAASLLASFVPALRATKVDPTVALRSE